MKPIGQPGKNAARNAAIIADYKSGIKSADIAKKHNLTVGYAQKIASEYSRKVKIETEKIEVGGGVLLYADRDEKMRNYYAAYAPVAHKIEDGTQA